MSSVRERTGLFTAPGCNLREHTTIRRVVLPMAINMGVTVLLRFAPIERRVHSVNVDETFEFRSGHPGPTSRVSGWTTSEGVAQMLIQWRRSRGAEHAA